MKPGREGNLNLSSLVVGDFHPQPAYLCKNEDPMIRFWWPLLFLLACTIPAISQNTLYDETRVPSIYISINEDSLAYIYANVLSDHYFSARFIFDDTERRDTLESAGFRLRGNTSRYAKKKSFKISFNEYVSGRKYQGVKKLNLLGEHNDPTMVREKLYYHLWKKSGMPERRTNFVKVFINEVYYGLYTNAEEMDKEWLARVYPDKTGNLYKCTYPADLVYLGLNQQVYKDLQNSTATGGRVYELETNKEEDDYARLVDLIATLYHEPDSVFTAQIAAILDVNRFLKSLALDVATGNWDDYGYNRNNFYLYDRPDNSLFEFITYDPDNAFGVDWSGIDWTTRNCLQWLNPDLNLPLAEKILAVPKFFEKYKEYLDTMARHIIEPDSVFPYIDSLKTLITPAAIADSFRSLDYGYTLASFENGFVQKVDAHTPYGIKPFLTKRKEYLLKQLHPSGIRESEALSQISITPNPVTDQLILSTGIRLSGILKVEIFDLSGRLIRVLSIDPVPGQAIRIDATSLSPGFHLVRIQSDSVTLTGRFVKN